MRYTKIALLIFGAGLVFGLVVVGAEVDRLARLASSLIALGLLALPLAMIIDWRLATRARLVEKRDRLPPRRRSTASTGRAARPRKAASTRR